MMALALIPEAIIDGIDTIITAEKSHITKDAS